LHSQNILLSHWWFKTIDNSYDSQLFSLGENCNKLFSIGRLFASAHQLTQVARIFLDAWAATSGTTQGKKIVCHYQKAVNKKTAFGEYSCSSHDC
jgi:hypothetical protein